MADRLLLSVSATQVSAARWQGGGFAGCDMFAAGDDGLAAFKNYLAAIPDLPVQMVVDAVEEDYRLDTLPHSYGSDRNEMVGRKLKQHYRNTPYVSAVPQGRDAGKRRDDRYLFCALTNPELIAPWVQAIVERGLPVAGICLRPTVIQRMVEKLQIEQTNLLVVSLHSSGTRLTFFRDQKLRISRLARIDLAGQAAIKGYAEEISNTRLYLHAVRIMTLDEQLSMLIIDCNDSLTELAQTITRDNLNIDCRRLGRQEIIASFGISMPALSSSSDAVYLHLLGLRAPDNNLAPATVTQGYRQHQARRGIYALTGVTAFALAVWCAFNLFQIFTTKSDVDAAVRQTAQLQAQYQEATRQFPAAPTTAENLKRTVEISQKIGALTRSPEAMLDIVGQALDSNPAIFVKTFGWKYGATDIDPEAGRSAKSSSDGGAPVAAGAPAVPRWQSGLVEGEVRPFRGDFRAAIEAINRFADTLSQQTQVREVRIVKLPLNINPSLTLAGNTTDSREQTGKAEFKLILVFKTQ